MYAHVSRVKINVIKGSRSNFGGGQVVKKVNQRQSSGQDRLLEDPSYCNGAINYSFNNPLHTIFYSASRFLFSTLVVLPIAFEPCKQIHSYYETTPILFWSRHSLGTD